MAISLSRRSFFLFCLAAVISAALWFRINGITANPFWLDEAYSAYAADQGFGFIFKVLPAYETHPPFYSAILSAWTDVFGNSLAGFRSLGLFAGIALIPLCFLAGRAIAEALELDSNLYLLAALALLAVSPPLVYITQLVRPYGVMALVYLFGIYCVFSLARHYNDNNRLNGKLWLGYLVSLALIIWLHNLGVLYAAALGLSLLILIGPLRLIGQHPRAFFIGHLAVALAVLPAFLILLDQAPTWQQSTWLRFHWKGVPENFCTIYGLSGFAAFVMAAFIVGHALLKGDKAQRPIWLVLLVLAFVPMLLSLLISAAIAPVFLPRTLAPLAVAFILLLAGAALSSLMTRVAFASLFVLTTIQVIGVQRLPPTENWHGAVAWLRMQVAPGDVIYAYPNEGALPLGYALRDQGVRVPIRPIPNAVPARDPSGWHPTGSRGVVSLPQYRLETIAADPQSARIGTIWLLRLGAATYDRDDGFLKALLRNRTPVGRWSQDPIEIIGLRQSPQIAPREQAQP